MLCQEVINGQAKRLKLFDSADRDLCHRMHAYATRRLENYGCQIFKAYGSEMKASRALATLIVLSLSNGAGFICVRELSLAKTLIGDIVNRVNGEKRRASRDVKATTIELTKVGSDALKAWKVQTNSSYSLIVETLLLDSRDLYVDIRADNTKKTEQIKALKDEARILNSKIKELCIQLQETGTERNRLARENISIRTELEACADETHLETSDMSEKTQEDDTGIDGDLDVPTVDSPPEKTETYDAGFGDDNSEQQSVSEERPQAIGTRTEALLDGSAGFNRLNRQKGLGNRKKRKKKKSK